MFVNVRQARSQPHFFWGGEQMGTAALRYYAYHKIIAVIGLNMLLVNACHSFVVKEQTGGTTAQLFSGLCA